MLSKSKFRKPNSIREYFVGPNIDKIWEYPKFSPQKLGNRGLKLSGSEYVKKMLKSGEKYEISHEFVPEPWTSGSRVMPSLGLKESLEDKNIEKIQEEERKKVVETENREEVFKEIESQKEEKRRTKSENSLTASSETMSKPSSLKFNAQKSLNKGENITYFYKMKDKTFVEDSESIDKFNMVRNKTEFIKKTDTFVTNQTQERI